MGVNLIDSRGYELSDGETNTFDTYMKSVKKQMEDSRCADPFNKIHIIWYCISMTGMVFQEYDKKTIEALLEDNELKERVNIQTPYKKLVVNNIFHNMSRLLLSEIKSCISQTYIGKIIFEICSDIFPPFDIISADL